MPYEEIKSGRSCMNCGAPSGKGPDWCDNCKKKREEREMLVRVYGEPQSGLSYFANVFEQRREQE